MKCILCSRELDKSNKSSYCSKHYTKSPQYKKYQRDYQRKWYKIKNGREVKRRYLSNPKIKAHYKKYQKEYQSQHKEKIREQKREWARKNRREQK